MNESRLSQIRREISELRKRRQEIVDQSQMEQATAQMPSNDMENNDLNQGMSNSQSKSMERGKVLTLSNGHSILGDNRFNGGFINMIIMALLAGFATGAIATAVYIFMNLGKVTVSL
ncbi:MAG: hypothetical protein HFH47_02535 [Bacilli bacterium]|nr:hypothetical protein [Bacilli bacterium]